MNEKNLEKNLNLYAKKHGVLSVKLSSPNSRGQPDRMFLYEGRAIFMELKGKGKKATALQLKYIDDLNNLGFIAEVVDDLTRGKELITRLITP